MNPTLLIVYQKGQKQFKEISFATKKRNQELKEKRKLVEDLKNVSLLNRNVFC